MVLGTERVVGETVLATVLVINPDGKIAGFQDKVQLDPTEDTIYAPGSGRRVFQTGPLRFGIAICPETAVCFDCLEQLRATGEVRQDEEVVVFNTGAAQKYPEVVPLDLPRLNKDAPLDWDGIKN